MFCIYLYREEMKQLHAESVTISTVAKGVKLCKLPVIVSQRLFDILGS